MLVRRTRTLRFVPFIILAAAVACTDTNAPRAAPVTLEAVGDIAGCETNGDELVAAMLDTLPGSIASLGDNVYLQGTLSQYQACFQPSWGRHKARIHPSPGNHDYADGGLAGYFAYFGDAAGPAGRGYYSYDYGSWHLISLNSEDATSAGSAQEAWLRADLAAHPVRCTLAYFHRPRFTSGDHLPDVRMQPLWQALYDADADLVVNGHEHDYERFAPQTPDGRADPVRGLRELVAGTGGFSAENTFPGNQIANSEFRRGGVLGVLRLTLADGGYDWKFQSTEGAIIDSGSGSCH
jgi:hypothetical protein